MKHILLFEDYSDEELRDLQDDLHGIGHKTKFTQGEDFGLGLNFKANDYDWIYYYPAISEEMFNLLLKRGEIIENSGYYYFKTPEKFGMIIDQNHKNPIISADGTSSSGEKVFVIEYGGRHGDNDSKIYSEMMKKLSEIRI